MGNELPNVMCKTTATSHWSNILNCSGMKHYADFLSFIIYWCWCSSINTFFLHNPYQTIDNLETDGPCLIRGWNWSSCLGIDLLVPEWFQSYLSQRTTTNLAKHYIWQISFKNGGTIYISDNQEPSSCYPWERLCPLVVYIILTWQCRDKI